MTASKTKASAKAKTSAAKRTKAAEATPSSNPQPSAQADVISVEPEVSDPASLESRPEPAAEREPKTINSTQAAAMLAGGVVVGRALGWL